MRCDVCGFYASDEPTLKSHVKREHATSLFDYGASTDSDGGEN